jgi:hypothetical protein
MVRMMLISRWKYSFLVFVKSLSLALSCVHSGSFGATCGRNAERRNVVRAVCNNRPLQLA